MEVICECGCIVHYEGLIPKYHTCFKCGRKIKIKDSDHENTENKNNRED